MDKKTKSLLLLGIPVVLSVIASIILQFTIISKPDQFQAWLSQFGPWVLVVYVVLQVITIIIAPIGGSFLQIALLALFPPQIALLTIYLTGVPAYLLNFYLARKYGRPLVQKIVGKKSLEKMDEIASDAGTTTLIILKIFQGGLFDYVSYAVGLTQIPFKTFLLVNVFCGIPSLILYYLIFSNFNNLTSSVIALYIVSYTLGIIAFYLNRYIKRKRS